MPPETVRWQLAEKFGWSLEYIDSLSMETLHEYLQIKDGMKGKGR
jgi:DNA-dependent RNA polymerase auxiliary subunit epsilon